MSEASCSSSASSAKRSNSDAVSFQPDGESAPDQPRATSRAWSRIRSAGELVGIAP